MRVPGLRHSAEQVGGLVFFGRMLDKMRLRAQGKLPPDYKTTGRDQRVCRFLRVEHVTLLELVLAGMTGQEALEWCFRAGNTWKPTSAVLRVEDRQHPATRQLPETFKSAPNEWYKWTNDLRTHSSIKILLSIDPASYPLGTGPKTHEIWHSGHYPAVWTHQRYLDVKPVSLQHA